MTRRQGHTFSELEIDVGRFCKYKKDNAYMNLHQKVYKKPEQQLRIFALYSSRTYTLTYHEFLCIPKELHLSQVFKKMYWCTTGH